MIQDFMIPARIFFEDWLQHNTILSDEDKEEAARDIAYDVQVGLPYHHSDLDDLLVEHPEWRDSDVETDDLYTHIQHNAGYAIFLELIGMWARDDE